MEARYGVPVLESYAMTEAAHQIASNPLTGARKPGSVGKPQGVAVSILDESGTPAKEGEVCIRGENVMKGYLRGEEAFFKSGWFRTGDRGWIDNEGYIWLTGRIKELINRGGEKISPVQVEQVIKQIPGVQEAVCFAVKDPVYGEAVAVALVCKDKSVAEKVPQWVTERLGKWQAPVKIWVVKEIPKTATGKVQRRKVRDFCAKL